MAPRARGAMKKLVAIGQNIASSHSPPPPLISVRVRFGSSQGAPPGEENRGKRQLCDFGAYVFPRKTPGVLGLANKIHRGGDHTDAEVVDSIFPGAPWPAVTLTMN